MTIKEKAALAANEARKKVNVVRDKAREIKLEVIEVKADAELRKHGKWGSWLADSTNTVPILIGAFSVIVVLSIVVVWLLNR